MDEIILYESKKPILISHDRSGCRITVGTSLPPQEIKKKLAYVADESKNVYVPSEITQEANAYTFYIRRRQSVKEYLISHECTILDFLSLVRSVSEIFNLAERLNLEAYGFIFDYSCVYTGHSLDTAEFVYAPGGSDVKLYNSVADMLTIASLHIRCDDNIKDADALKEAAAIITEWEEYGRSPFPFEEISAVLNVDERNEKVLFTTWKPFLYFQFAMILALVFILSLIPFREEGIFIWIAWLLLTVSIDYLLIPGKKLKNIRFISERTIRFKGSGFLKGNIYTLSKGNINLGRDSKWADIRVDHIFVSRQHAVITHKNKSVYIKDLNSKNGTYLDGKKIDTGEEILLKKGSVISIGNSDIRMKFIQG